MWAMGDPSIDRLAGSWTRREAWRPVAPLGLAGVVVLLEAAVWDLDHGTHLLVALAAVVATALALGPRPAAVGLVLGALVAAAASLFTEAQPAATPRALVQLVSYLFAGGASIALVAIAARPGARQLAGTRLRPSPRGHSARDPQLSVPGQDSAAHVSPVEALTTRELEILRLATSGATVDEMARHLCISPNTVKTHLTHVYGKLGVRGRTDAVRAALHAGCLTPADICPHLSGPAVSSVSSVPVAIVDGETPSA